ncbi:MAG: ABC transporter ATP-binding protein [Myxococcales bacterium]|nr:ABC transporter ATP-binding protein [Myxococcales bacterium]
MALAALAWRPADVGDALHLLAARAGLAADAAAPPRPAQIADDDWLDALAEGLGVEVEPVALPFGALDGLLAGGAPALIRCDAGVIALCAARGRRVWVLGPDRRRHALPAAALAAALRARVVERVAPGLAALFAEIGLPKNRRRRAEAAMLQQAFAEAPVGEAWLVRAPPDAPLWRQARDLGLPGQAARAVGLYLAAVLVGLAAWWLVGDGALDGRLPMAAIAAWVLALLTAVPFDLGGRWARARLAVGFGALLKKRLLLGALRIDPDAMRTRGAGALMGQVFEADALEALALSSVFGAVMALVEVALAAAVLAAGAGGWPHAAALGVFVLLVAALTVAAFRRQSRATASRLALSADLVERMVGQRTRLVQTRPGDWHADEDRALAAHLAELRRADAVTLPLALLGRGWLVVGVAVLGPAFLAGASPAALAVSIGGLLLAGGALTTLGGGLGRLSTALIAWKTVGELFRAARRTEPAGDPAALARVATPAAPGATILDAQGLAFAWRPGGRPVLDGCDLVIRQGERLLLQGPSGGGKSTLAALLTGLRRPQAGLVLLDGHDHRTLGATGWRRRIAAAPQFHDNHVFGGSLAFNLLLGRSWPPAPGDLEDAEAVCRALGLGPLIEKMPAGLQQQVGETGWQLSHGERSRVFLARALLQRSDLVVLDESFGALDPVTVDACLRCALDRAPSLLVIAHP